MLVNVDRFVVGEDVILECKIVLVYLVKEWEVDEVLVIYLV